MAPSYPPPTPGTYPAPVAGQPTYTPGSPTGPGGPPSPPLTWGQLGQMPRGADMANTGVTRFWILVVKTAAWIMAVVSLISAIVVAIDYWRLTRGLSLLYAIVGFLTILLTLAVVMMLTDAADDIRHIRNRLDVRL